MGRIFVHENLKKPLPKVAHHRHKFFFFQYYQPVQYQPKSHVLKLLYNDFDPHLDLNVYTYTLFQKYRYTRNRLPWFPANSWYAMQQSVLSKSASKCEHCEVIFSS